MSRNEKRVAGERRDDDFVDVTKRIRNNQVEQKLKKRFIIKKIYGPIYNKRNNIIQLKEDDLGNLTGRKLTRHIQPPSKPYNFSIKQFFIRRIIEKLFRQACKSHESPWTRANSIN